MRIRLSEFNLRPGVEAEIELLRICGSRRWAKEMAEALPFHSILAMQDRADRIWEKLSSDDWREAFLCHPRIGEKASPEKAGSAVDFTKEEQKGVLGPSGANPEERQALSKANQAYEAKFGHIFLVCATGKNAGEMLKIVKERLTHDCETELKIAAGEQAKITRIRLERLFTS